MPSLSFEAIIRSYFDFLIRKHGYQMKFFSGNNLADGDGSACIFSNRTTVNILKSRFDYMITIGPAGEPEFTRLSILWILRALSVDVEEHGRQRTDLDTFEGYVKFYSELVRDYCSQFIEGDFSAWPSILQYFVNKSKNDYLARTGKKLPNRVHGELEEYIKSKKAQRHYP